FTATVGNNPIQQTLSVNASQQTAFSLTTSTSSGGNWLAVSPTNGVTATNLGVVVTSASLAAGTYNGSINFSTGQSVAVTLSVTTSGGGNSGNVTTTPSASVGFTFTGQTGSGTLTAQTLQVANASG